MWILFKNTQSLIPKTTLSLSDLKINFKDLLISNPSPAVAKYIQF